MIGEREKIDTTYAERRPNGGKNVVLTISDHLGWEDVEGVAGIDDDHHMRLLLDKFEVYVSFVESGSILNHFSDLNEETDKITIEIASKYFPNETGRKFMDGAKKFLGDRGFQFRLRGPDLQIVDDWHAARD